MATTYNRYHHPLDRYEARADGRPLVAGLAITLLLLTLAFVAYLVYATFSGYEHGGNNASADLASAAHSIQADISHSPKFINTAILR